MNEIVLSVVVATYNRLPELQTMLDSLLPQVKGKPVEILIADDRSTDDTWEWLQSRFEGVPDIYTLRAEKNGGPGRARNLCLDKARGRFFMPVDSDFIVIDGAIESVLAALAEHNRYHLLFFPCLQYPAMTRLGTLNGDREVGYEDFLTEKLGEAVPVADLNWLDRRGLRYPLLRAGAESVLWAEMLASGPSLFVDIPIILYRTDSADRICTLKYQLEHPADLAAAADAMVEVFARRPSPALRFQHARKCLAAGSYHLLTGNARTGRQRLLSAVSLGCAPAAAAFLLSFMGRDAFTRLFGCTVRELRKRTCDTARTTNLKQAGGLPDGPKLTCVETNWLGPRQPRDFSRHRRATLRRHQDESGSRPIQGWQLRFRLR